jgi:hypothetical protein
MIHNFILQTNDYDIEINNILYLPIWNSLIIYKALTIV